MTTTTSIRDLTPGTVAQLPGVEAFAAVDSIERLRDEYPGQEVYRVTAGEVSRKFAGAELVDVREDAACENCDEPEGQIGRRSDGATLCDGCDRDLERDDYGVEDEREFYGLDERDRVAF